MIGNLYFLQEGPNGCIKIGWTAGDPDNRRRAMQVGNSSDLTIIGFREAPADAETGWHVRFSHICKRSEWFYPTAELLAPIIGQPRSVFSRRNPPPETNERPADTSRPPNNASFKPGEGNSPCRMPAFRH